MAGLKKVWFELSTAYVGHGNLSHEEQKVVNTILISKVSGIKIRPTTVRTVARRDGVAYNRGWVNTILDDFKVEDYDGSQTTREIPWLSTDIAGLDFLELVLINELGFEFQESYAWMLNYANSPTNSSTEPVLIGVKNRPEVVKAESIFQEQVRRQVFLDRANQRRLTERYSYA